MLNHEVSDVIGAVDGASWHSVKYTLSEDQAVKSSMMDEEKFKSVETELSYVWYEKTLKERRRGELQV